MLVVQLRRGEIEIPIAGVFYSAPKSLWRQGVELFWPH